MARSKKRKCANMFKYFWYNIQATALSAEKLLVNLFHKMLQQKINF